MADASGAKYSVGSTTSPTPSAPQSASKPAFTPTRSGAGSTYNPLGGSSARRTEKDANVDDDGWGADAPPVSRSQLEKVQSAYQPTKVNMAELTKQKQEPSRFNAPARSNADNEDVVRGGYQPIGKVDIAAIRAQAKNNEDDRPTIVKGAYEPVGKVDIAAIRAKAQKPASESQAPKPAPSATEDEQPKSLAERSAAFSQSERLTALPKPKVAGKFGAAANFTGTKPLQPPAFGLHSAAPQVEKAAPVGAASKTFADEGGKTPAQIWAEKKAKERGQTVGSATAPAPAPIISQSSGGGEWKSGYTGKSWAPVSTNKTGASNISAQRTGERPESRHEDEAPSSPAGGVGALRDRFKGAAPMGAPSLPSHRTGGSDAAPPVPSASRPGVSQEDDENRGRPNIPSPPRVQRSPTPPTPEREDSPVRIAVPVSRTKEPKPLTPQQPEPEPAMPIRSLEKQASREEDDTDEPSRTDTARAVGAGVAGGAIAGAAAGAAASFGYASAQSTEQGQSGGKRALVQYDYEKAEDNEIELVEGDYVTNIEMVDDDWWMGTNSKGESGLFPSNYVELVEEETSAPAAPPAKPASPEPASAPPAPQAAAAQAAKSGPSATALYDYEAAEDNELSFDENDKITDLVSLQILLLHCRISNIAQEFPDEDWWFGHKGGKSGLFPSNYVQLDD